MKYNFEKITSSEYLNLVNREEDPDSEELKIKYIQVGDGYMIYANSAYGKVLTPAYNKKDVTDEQLDLHFDELTEDVKKRYEGMKGRQIMPRFLPFGGVGA